MKSRSRVQLRSNEGEVTDSGANYVKKHHVLAEEERGEEERGRGGETHTVNNKAINRAPGEREVEWAKLSKFEVRRRKERGESRERIQLNSSGKRRTRPDR